MLMKSDFQNDAFEFYINKFINAKHKSLILFSYRLAKYAQANTNKSTQIPFLTIKSLINKIKLQTTDYQILTILLYYIVKNSYLLTDYNIACLFSQDWPFILVDVKELLELDNIANSNAVITKNKQRQYKLKFPQNIISIKAADILANLQTLDVSTSYLNKVFFRYLPILSVHKTVEIIVRKELKKIVFKTLKNPNKNINLLDLTNFYQMLK